MRVTVNADRCMGTAICAMVAVDTFEFDEDGYAYVVAHPPYDDASAAAIREAARACPTNAIEVTDD